MWRIHRRVSSALEKLGYQATSSAEHADVIVLNTCVVRQSAEDKAHGRLSSLRPLKDARPDLVINLMGCMVGVRGDQILRERYPYVDVFSPPSDPGPLLDFLAGSDGRELEEDTVRTRFALMDGDLRTPAGRAGIARYRLCAHRLWLLARLYLLRHPLPARRRTQPVDRRDCT